MKPDFKDMCNIDTHKYYTGVATHVNSLTTSIQPAVSLSHGQCGAVLLTPFQQDPLETFIPCSEHANVSLIICTSMTEKLQKNTTSVEIQRPDHNQLLANTKTCPKSWFAFYETCLAIKAEKVKGYFARLSSKARNRGCNSYIYLKSLNPI